MSTPIITVTEGRQTIVANDTEANIRESAGFAAAEPKPDAKPEAKPAESTESTERGPDGKFIAKAKAEETPAKPDKYGGDPRTSVQAKINYEKAQAEEAIRSERRENQRLRDELAAKSAPVARTPTPQAPVEPTPAAAPTYLDEIKRYSADPAWPKLDEFVAAGFDDPYAACNAAQAAFVQDQRMKAHADKQEGQRRQQAQSDIRRAVAQAGAEKYPDWDEAIAAAGALQMPAPVLDEIDHLNDPSLSADVLRHLLTHPEDAEQVASATTPIAAARAIASLSARIVAAHSGPADPPRQTRAKPLIKPVSASPAAPESGPPDPEKTTFQQWKKLMDAEERKGREARLGA